MKKNNPVKIKESEKFDPLSLLNTFYKLLDKEELTFLNNKNDIKGLVVNLKAKFNLATKSILTAKERLKKKQNDKNATQDELDSAMREAEKGISEYLDWNEVHLNARELWKRLISAAINFIDPSSKGNSKLFEYLEDSSKFEDVLYGLEDFYRDHTLHSIWVYLMGVQLMCEGGVLSNVSKNLNWYLFNDIESGADKYPYPKHLQKWAKLHEGIFKEQMQHYKESVWCIMALCHDLGYSLAKLEKLNERVADVLKHFHMSDFQRVGYKLDIEHQYLVEQFLEIMAMDVRIVPGEDYQDLEEETISEYYKKHKQEFKFALNKLNESSLLDELISLIDIENPDRFNIIEGMKAVVKNSKKLNEEPIINLYKDIEEQTLFKCYRDDSTYWRLCKALERKEHGILSAYLIYKTLGLFADTSIRGASEEWGLEDQEVIYNVIRGGILFAIAQHEFAYTHINQLGSLAEILIICDELEEFTRLGRKMLSRKYTDTSAETGIKIEESKVKNYYKRIEGYPILMELTYKSTHEKPKKFYHFVWRKMKRVCTLYSLDQTRDVSEKVYFPIHEIIVKFDHSLSHSDDEDEEFYSPVQKTDEKLNQYQKIECTFTMEKVDNKVNFIMVVNEFKVDSLNKPEKMNYILDCVDDKILLVKNIDDKKEKIDKNNKNSEPKTLEELFKI